MIESLRIENLATITGSELNLTPGFTVITGETGAGKTMLLTSLAWLLGAKTDPSLVRAGTAQAAVEGTFVVPTQASDLITDAGGALEDDVVEIARVVPSQARSKAHLGGRTVPASVLSTLGEFLVSIHGQSTQNRLRGAKAQREALDSAGNAAHQAALATYAEAWTAQHKARLAWEEWTANSELREARREKLGRWLEGFEALQPQDGEYSELTTTVTRLTNAETLRVSVLAALQALAGETAQNGAGTQVAEAAKGLVKASEQDESLAEIRDSVLGIESELSEVSRALQDYLEQLEAEPEVLENAHARRAAFMELSRQTGADPDELGGAWETCRAEWETIGSGQDRLDELQADLDACEAKLRKAGDTLHKARVETASQLTKQINAELKGLDMKQTVFDIAVSLGEAAAHGADKVEFMLQPYRGAPTLSLGAAASGGELSRIMLALEVVLAARSRHSGADSARPTLVFDEVDAGIGGQAGLEVGRRLAQLARDYQVIVVTHLAQVAAFANAQVRVSKEGSDSCIESLDAAQRREELARMISGKTVTKTALKHADELFAMARVGQSEA